MKTSLIAPLRPLVLLTEPTHESRAVPTEARVAITMVKRLGLADPYERERVIAIVDGLGFAEGAAWLRANRHLYFIALREVGGVMHDQDHVQWVPVKVYQSAERITVAAPMPGMNAEDITVEITPGNQLVLHGNGRGGLKHENLVLGDEWNPGPYCREITLPHAVDGSMANVTYRNGILVVALPISQETRPAHLKLELVGSDYGERVGNAGHPIYRLTASEHSGSGTHHHEQS